MMGSYHYFNFDAEKCNVCGRDAEYEVKLELVWSHRNNGYSKLTSEEMMPFYLCNKHSYLYERMQKNVELTEYFQETVNANK